LAYIFASKQTGGILNELFRLLRTCCRKFTTTRTPQNQLLFVSPTLFLSPVPLFSLPSPLFRASPPPFCFLCVREKGFPIPLGLAEENYKTPQNQVLFVSPLFFSLSLSLSSLPLFSPFSPLPLFSPFSSLPLFPLLLSL
jgi:hypothetical protein